MTVEQWIEMAWWTVGWMASAAVIGFVFFVALGIREIRSRRARVHDMPIARVVQR